MFSIISLLNSSTVLLVVILDITTIISEIMLDTSLHHFLQYCCCSVAKLCQTLWPHALQHTRLACPSPSPGICSNSCPLSWWCHPTISPSIVPFSSYLQSFPASRSLPMSRLFASGGQSIGASALASILPMNIQGWYPLRLTGFISLLSKGLSGVFSGTTVKTYI